jgi:hypothetical protein
MKKVMALALCSIGMMLQAQSPQLHVKGIDSALVRMSQLKVSVKVVGNRAYTTSEMHFYNGTTRQMEAELVFPLPEGVSVSRYAIDINGKLREAVPVDKNKGKQVFEAVEHRRVDPGLLEKVAGNTFRTRIYPLLPGKERIVVIGYEQELTALDNTHLGYQMLSTYPQAIDEFECKVSVYGATAAPTVATDEGIVALENLEQSYQARLEKKHYRPKDKLMISIPIRDEVPSVVVQEVDNQYYFYANTILDSQAVPTPHPHTLGLIWDVSLSCRHRDIKKELQLLDAYLKGLNTVEVTLYLSGYTFEKKATFSVKEGNWSALRNQLESLKYDGGTRYSQIKVGNQDAFVFFTDGLSTLSSNTLVFPRKPVYTITSNAVSDFDFLHYTAQRAGGAFVNLTTLSVEEALNKMVFQPLKFLGVKDNYKVLEMYPMVGTPVSGSFSVAGISLIPNTQIVLQFGYGDTPVYEKTITIEASKVSTDAVSIEKLWAQKKLAYLQLQPKQNAVEIENIGKKFGIVTANTPLIVLESLQDYIQYEIAPPAELRPEFERIMKEQVATARARKMSNWEQIDRYYTELANWWKKDTRYEMPKPKPVKTVTRHTNLRARQGWASGIVSDKTGPLPGANVVVKGTTRSTQTDFDGKFSIEARPGEELEFSFIGYGNSRAVVNSATPMQIQLNDSNAHLEEVVVVGYRSNTNAREIAKEEEDDEVVSRKKSMMAYSTVSSSTISEAPNANVIQSLQGKVAGVTIATGNANPHLLIRGASSTGTFAPGAADSISIPNTGGQIERQKWNPDRMYLKALLAAPADKQYELYLDLRETQVENPSYYFDVAQFFYEHGHKEMALQVLSTIADLGLENHQLYKSLTYVLRQWGATEEALYTAQQVALWRAQEPQAHRDLALALEDNQQYQEAFDELIKGLEVNYFGEMSGQYEGVEDIILMDMNRMIAAHKNIKTGSVDKKYLNKMPVGIRVILNWNQMDTDIDLHVIEPTNEECYYAHRDTQLGARFSKDFTQGYGPEQYLVRNPVAGKYTVRSNYYGERALTENGPATVLVEVYVTKNGKTERSLQTIQLGTVKENQNLAVIEIE